MIFRCPYRCPNFFTLLFLICKTVNKKHSTSNSFKQYYIFDVKCSKNKQVRRTLVRPDCEAAKVRKSGSQ